MGTRSIISEQIKSDFKLIIRDPLLRVVIVILLLMSFLFRIVVPQLGPFLAPWGLTLGYLNPFLVSFMFVLFVPMGIGMVIGFLLLDEKDNQTIKALAITPVSLNRYFLYRMIMPIILGTGLIVISVYIVWLVYIEFFALLFIAAVTALEGPLWTLIISTFAKNKVQGFTVLKMGGFLFIIPVIAYFIPPTPFELLFGIAPTYWTVKAFWVAAAGDPSYWIYLLVGIIYHIGLMIILFIRFNNVMKQ